MSRAVRHLVTAVVLTAAGCTPAEPPRPDTGAKAAAVDFFSAVTGGDPSRAYAMLHPDSTKRLTAEQFAALASGYARSVGFAVEKVTVHASEEQGDRATVHVTLHGHGGGHSRRYADALTLRREADRWLVVLPANFGRK